MKFTSPTIRQSCPELRASISDLISRLPEESRAIFSDAHLQALEVAQGQDGRGSHPVEIRLTIPTIMSRYQLLLQGGPRQMPGGKSAWHGPFSDLFLFGAVLGLGLFVLQRL